MALVKHYQTNVQKLKQSKNQIFPLCTQDLKTVNYTGNHSKSLCKFRL